MIALFSAWASSSPLVPRAASIDCFCWSSYAPLTSSCYKLQYKINTCYNIKLRHYNWQEHSVDLALHPTMQLYAAGKPCTLQLPRGRVLSQQQQRGWVELHNNSSAQCQGFKRPSCKYFESGQDPPKWLESFSIHFNRISFESFSMENIRHSWSFSLLQRNQRYLQNLPNVKKLLIALTTQWTIKWRQRGADVINVAAMCCCCYLFFAVDVSYRPHYF